GPCSLENRKRMERLKLPDTSAKGSAMARMVPDYVTAECRSSAERKLFDRFRRELPDALIVLHSLGIAKNRRKLYSEIDFVILSTRGVLALAVKGGKVSRRAGRWYFRNRYGEESAKR